MFDVEAVLGEDFVAEQGQDRGEQEVGHAGHL